MVEVFTLRCPSCNGKLEITRDVNRFACGHCGNEHIVIRSGGTVTLKPVVEEIKGMRDDVVRVKRSIEVNNAELAVARIGKELTALKAELRNFDKRENRGGCSPIMMGLIGFFIFLSGLGSFTLGMLVFSVIILLVGIFMMFSAIIFFISDVSETNQLKKRIADLEKKKQAYTRIINRGP